MDTVKGGEWRKIVDLMCWIQVGAGIAMVGLFAFLPLFLVELGIHDAGEAAFWAGILSGVTPLMIALSSPFWAMQGDRHGVKRVLCIVLAAVSCSAFLCSVSTSPWQILLWRVLQGAVGGFVPIGLAVVASVTPEEHTSWAMGRFQAAMIVGVMFGPLVGGFIADLFGYRMPFVVFGLLSLFCLLAVWKRMPHIGRTERKESVSTWKEIRYFAGIPKIRLMVGLQFLCNFGISGIGPILPLYVSQMLGSDVALLATIVGTIIFLAGGANAISSMCLGKITQTISSEKILLVAPLFVGATFVLQYGMPNVWGLGFFRFLTGFGMGLIMPIANTMIAQSTPHEKRTIVFGVVSSVVLMGSVAGPVVSGALALAWGYGSVFWSTAIAFWFAAWWLYRFSCRYRNSG